MFMVFLKRDRKKTFFINKVLKKSFYVIFAPLENFSLPLPLKDCKFWTLLGTQGHWVVRVLSVPNLLWHGAPVYHDNLWFIDWLDSGLHRIDNITTMYPRRLLVKCYQCFPQVLEDRTPPDRERNPGPIPIIFMNYLFKHICIFNLYRRSEKLPKIKVL